MASGKILRQLIKAGANGDTAAFRQASEAIIQEEREKQHHLLANDLERILYGDTFQPQPLRHGLKEHIPIDQERGLPLLIVREPARRMDEVVLTPEAKQVVEDVLEQHNRGDVLRSYGMRPSDRLLFCGPPGCGKTVTAEVIATELDRPLALIRLDSVVSSYLGETAANLRKVFDFIESISTVALFDEFDALGKERADASEHGELKRVVNAVLQMLDAYQGKSLIIAATNHEGILDSAIWRRFEEVVVFPPPSGKETVELLGLKSRGVRRDFEANDKKVLTLFKGRSHADIERILRRAIKEMILKGQEFLSIGHLKRAHEREIPRDTRLKMGKSKNARLSASED
ncbi:AAA family ATPase [Nitrospira lenta]|uniref:AAA ATPase, central region n=1 Tax=Nitrospira lenta TaxID=1436998 RepID=A0A330L2H5_9BACT|nr:ATP-binding protein [Nitrospira lenta]SPP63961.1 AAA ATPase, central region [Nitrospira lenta]